MGHRVEIDPVLGHRHRVGADLGFDLRRVTEEGRRFRRGEELRAELSEHQVLAALADEPEGGGVPEQSRPAVSDEDLVSVGQGEQFGDGVAQRSDLEEHRSLAVRRAQIAGRGRQGLDRLGADLGRATTEAAVRGEQVGGDVDRVAHRPQSPNDRPSVEISSTDG